MSLLLGIDLGTSAVKALLFDLPSGLTVAHASVEHPSSSPKPGWSEQDPRDWWAASAGAVRRVLERVGPGESARIRAIGLSGQMHGSVLLPRDAANHPARAAEAGEVIRPAILWNDQRTARECAEIEEAVGGRSALVAVTGNAALTGFTAPKLLWVRRHEPAAWARVGTVLLPKDYLRWRLTGALATDAGDASGTLLLDLDRRAWATDLARALGIDPSLLPPVLESQAIAGRVSSWAARHTGLPEGTPVVAGSGDNMCAAVGVGVVAPGAVLASLGTSGVILAHADAPTRDAGVPGSAPPGRLQGLCAATGPRGWCALGCMLSAGASLKWARSVLAPDAAYGDLLADAARVPPGCDGLVFLPYLTGERCPHPDPDARGGWIGLTARHTRAHLLRAVLEGVAFGMAQILDLARAGGVTPAAVRLTGGGARSPLWRQIHADALGVAVESAGGEEGGCALGAALLAASAAGWPEPLPDLCTRVIAATDRLEPDPRAAERLAPARAAFDRLYADLRTASQALARGA